MAGINTIEVGMRLNLDDAIGTGTGERNRTKVKLRIG